MTTPKEVILIRKIRILEKSARWHRERAAMWTAERRPLVAKWHLEEADQLDAELAALPKEHP